MAEVPEIGFLQLGRGVTLRYAALLKLNRITKAEKIYSGAGILAMLLLGEVSELKTAFPIRPFVYFTAIPCSLHLLESLGV